jgi:nucleoside-diphosphate-sugar epimerase
LTIALSAGSDPLGRRVRAALRDSDAVGEVREAAAGDQLGEDVDLVVWVGSPADRSSRSAVALDGRSAISDIAQVTALLEAAAEAHVDHVVVVSSALVYGAGPDRPVPLTETEPTAPEAGFAPALAYASVEHAALSLPADVTVLRLAIAVGPELRGWFRRSPWARIGRRTDGGDPPVQFVHLDDVATAVCHVVTNRLVGTFNVAADGWLSSDEVRVLHNRRALWPLGAAAVPPGAEGYLRWPWVVANDRLRATGWAPGSTNEECFVDVDTPGPLGTLSPRRRQELALAGSVVVGVATVAAIVVGLRRRRRQPPGRATTAGRGPSRRGRRWPPRPRRRAGT